MGAALGRDSDWGVTILQPCCWDLLVTPPRIESESNALLVWQQNQGKGPGPVCQEIPLTALFIPKG